MHTTRRYNNNLLSTTTMMMMWWYNHTRVNQLRNVPSALNVMVWLNRIEINELVRRVHDAVAVARNSKTDKNAQIPNSRRSFSFINNIHTRRIEQYTLGLRKWAHRVRWLNWKCEVFRHCIVPYSLSTLTNTYTHTRWSCIHTQCSQTVAAQFFDLLPPFRSHCGRRRVARYTYQVLVLAERKVILFFISFRVNASLTGFLAALNKRSVRTDHRLCGVSRVKQLPLHCAGPIQFRKIY